LVLKELKRWNKSYLLLLIVRAVISAITFPNFRIQRNRKAIIALSREGADLRFLLIFAFSLCFPLSFDETSNRGCADYQYLSTVHAAEAESAVSESKTLIKCASTALSRARYSFRSLRINKLCSRAEQACNMSFAWDIQRAISNFRLINGNSILRGSHRGRSLSLSY